MAVGDTLNLIFDTCGGYEDIVFVCTDKWRVTNKRPEIIKVNTVKL